eukprot:TRINITY_DN11651_c0_g1_i3.p1 TRINITY_DN11651_c0_g1~~TRINITY_DN11651_c0_g1_i3.p1  ORF type:complete len:901 (-),score=269.17 TRINITY_DN11651_c0_g1_i3:361-3063(-)
MDNNPGPCETQLGGGAVERQVSQTNNLQEETIVMPEQLEKKNIDVDDLPSEDLVGKVQVNSSGVEVEENTSSENHETKVNGHSNDYVNGVSGSDSEAEIDGSDSENEDKETGLNSLADTPIDDAVKTESDDNLAADISLTSNSVAETDENKLEETMGPNNEAADAVSYDIDLDKSVPELVTEFELLTQGTTQISASVIQTESSFFSSSSSTSSTSVKTSRIPVAVDKKRSSVISRQNTYTVETSNSGDETSSFEPIMDTQITEDESIEDEVDASIGSLLQRQNTYTVKTSEVHESSKVSHSFNSVAVEESVSTISDRNLHLDLNSQINKETSDEVCEKSVGLAISEEVHVTEEAFNVLEPLDNSQIVSEVPEQVVETPAKEEIMAEAVQAIENLDQSDQIVEEKITEKIIQKLEAQDTTETIGIKYSDQEDSSETNFQEADLLEGNVDETKATDIPVTDIVSEKQMVLESAPNTKEKEHHLESTSDDMITGEVEKPEEEVQFAEENITIQRLGAQNIIENTDSLFKEPEETLLHNIQEADVELVEEISEASEGSPGVEDGHIPEEEQKELEVSETSVTANEETQLEKEPVVEIIEAVKQTDTSVPTVEEQVSDQLTQKQEEVNSTEGAEPLYKDPEDALELNDTQYKPTSNEVPITKVEDQYVTAEEVRIQKHKVIVKDEIFPEDVVIPQSIPTMCVENQDLTKEPTILEETSLLNTHIPLIVPLVSIPVCSTITENKETDPDKNTEEENIRTSKDVEQLLRDIRDPNLDCSLEDIEAMIEGKELVPPKEELNRVSPEFATAATLIDQNPDKGFDPEDPAVKGIEDWECSNLNTSLESVESRSSKLKSVFKRRRSRSEERKSLLDDRSNGNNNEEEDEEEKVSMGCINSWLLYIFIKIFD